MSRLLIRPGERALAMAAAIAEVSVAELIEHRRMQAMVRARAAVALALRRRGLSTPRIGAILDRDHSTALHAIRQARVWAESDPEFAWMVEAIEAAAKPLLTPALPPELVARFVRPEPVAPVREPEPDVEEVCAEEASFERRMIAGSQAMAAALRNYAGRA